MITTTNVTQYVHDVNKSLNCLSSLSDPMPWRIIIDSGMQTIKTMHIANTNNPPIKTFSYISLRGGMVFDLCLYKGAYCEFPNECPKKYNIAWLLFTVPIRSYRQVIVDHAWVDHNSLTTGAKRAKNKYHGTNNNSKIERRKYLAQCGILYH